MTLPRSPYEAGNPNAKVLVLGQAPSSVEMRMNEPLVGPAGQIFNECLAKAGISRRELYILNVWEDPVYTDKRTGQIYSYKDGPHLWKNRFTDLGLELSANTRERIRASGANIIIALGQQALELVTGINNKIMKWRGSPLWSEEFGKKVIGTVHPAAIIHGVYIWKYLLLSDLQKAFADSRAPELILPQRNIITRPTFDQVRDGFNEVRKQRQVATDLEVINKHTACFCLCTTPDSGVVVPFVDDSGHYWSEEEEIAIWRDYASVMGDAEIMKINQAIIDFDAPFLLWKNNIITRGPIGDPMIGYSLLYPEFPKDLGYLGSIYTREPYWKDEGKMWKDAGGDFDQFWRYNGKDGCVALECWLKVEEELKELGMWQTYIETTELLEPILFMTIHGLNIDRDAIADTEKIITKQIEELEEELDRVAEKKFNPLSSKQCADYFYGLKGLKPYIGPGGNVTTDDKALSRIFRKTGLREAKLVQEIRNKRKLRSTYIEIQFDEDGRLRCQWKARGTWTGRLSSGQTIFGTGANLQNLDPRFKGFVIDEEDYENISSSRLSTPRRDA